jgi:hypothetical protein
VHDDDAVLGGQRRTAMLRLCTSVVIGSLRRSNALPPSAITIRIFSLLAR